MCCQISGHTSFFLIAYLLVCLFVLHFSLVCFVYLYALVLSLLLSATKAMLKSRSVLFCSCFCHIPGLLTGVCCILGYFLRFVIGLSDTFPTELLDSWWKSAVQVAVLFCGNGDMAAFPSRFSYLVHGSSLSDLSGLGKFAFCFCACGRCYTWIYGFWIFRQYCIVVVLSSIFLYAVSSFSPVPMSKVEFSFSARKIRKSPRYRSLLSNILCTYVNAESWAVSVVRLLMFPSHLPDAFVAWIRTHTSGRTSLFLWLLDDTMPWSLSFCLETISVLACRREVHAVCFTPPC